MPEPFVFDPRHESCKTPFGAVSCGQTLSFFCRPLASECFSHCAVCFHYEFAGTRFEQELIPEGPQGERVRFGITLSAPEQADLVWYHFRFWREDGSGCILDKTGYRSDGNVAPWQLTVYEKSSTPDWFGRGVSYQIFPDRFCRLTVPDPTGMIGPRTVQADWNSSPHWRPGEDGEVQNRNFFGGSLSGIVSKLEYFATLGVSTLYLCPIFESASNHRYNTADYSRIDPMLGTEEDFKTLCAKAEELGIRILLDGVFNHTGSQSLYFNADGFYPSLGAAQSQDSPYYDWYAFHPWPHRYDAWWGIRTLPAVREDSPGYVDYIIENENAIVRRWLRSGASGWRLDVADELPDWFIEKLRTAVEETKSDALLLGEVWEDASNKISYSKRRRYFLGKELHGVMNYPFRTALLNYLNGGNADDFREAMETLRENYPPAAFHSAMNFLGTHDTARILTVLGASHMPEDKAARAVYRLSPEERALGLARVRLAALVLFSFPGSPTVYYGDEVGMEGWEDPFNRGTYPWDSGDTALRDHFARLGGLRRMRHSLQRGDIRWLYTADTLLVYERTLEGERTVTAVNAGAESKLLCLEWGAETARDLLTEQDFFAENGQLRLTLPPLSGMLLA